MAAKGDKPDDIEALLREVEQTLSGGPAATPAGKAPAPTSGSSAARRSEQESSSPRPVLRAARGAVIAAAVAAALVWLLFFFVPLPFTAPASGAAGAFVGVLLAWFTARLARR
jgi:hypothetical protein